MIAQIQSFDVPVEHLRAKFLVLLPRIQHCCRFQFRGVRCAGKRADCTAETIALCWKWFVRLAERGKDAGEFITTMTFVAARSVKNGRLFCGQERAKDVMSAGAQKRNGFTVESLPISTRIGHEKLYGDAGGQRRLDEFEERLRDNTMTPPPDQAAFRIDWPRFMSRLTHRDRELARFLSLGHGGKKAAYKFGLSPGRVTQLRRQWCKEWRAFEE